MLAVLTMPTSMPAGLAGEHVLTALTGYISFVYAAFVRAASEEG